MTTTLRVGLIRAEDEPRAEIDDQLVREYQEAMDGGAKFPPLTVFHDGTYHWLADGFHRLHASMRVGWREVDCEVIQGTQGDAQWYGFAANQQHGKRRTTEDKQRAVQAALKHPKGAGLSDHQIAEHVGVAVSTVGDWRKKLVPTIGNLQSAQRTCRDGRTMNVAEIGKKRATPISNAVGHRPEPKTETNDPLMTRWEKQIAALWPKGTPAEQDWFIAWIGFVFQPDIEQWKPSQSLGNGKKPARRQAVGA